MLLASGLLLGGPGVVGLGGVGHGGGGIGRGGCGGPPRSSRLRCVVVCFLGTRLCLFVSRKSQNTTNLFCAGSLDGAPIITQSRRHEPCSKIEVSYSAHSQLAFDASLLFTDCSATATATCDLRAAALLLFEAITLLPLLRPRRGLTHLGGRHNAKCRAGPEKEFWTSTCVGYRSITVVETHTLRCSHGTPVVSASFIRRVRLCHGCGSWRKLQKKPSPGTLHGRCTRSKAVGTSNHNIP